MKALGVIVLICVAWGRNPGLTGSVDQNTLTDAFNLAAGIGTQLAPGNYGNYTTDVTYSIFDLHVLITDITLTSVTYDSAESGIQLFSPDFIVVTVSGVQALGWANYNTRMGLIDLTGTAKVSAADISLVANVTVSVSSQGMPQFQVNSATVNIGSVTVTSSLPTDLNDFVNDEIKDELASLQSSLPSLIEEYVPQINALLNSYSTVVPISGTDLSINLGLTAAPMVVNNEYIFGGLDGTVFSTNIGEPATEPAAGLPYRTALNEGFQGLASDYAITEALTWVAPLFSYLLTTVPSSLPFTLDTTTFALLLPALVTVYGSDQPMNVRIYYAAASPAPQFSTYAGILTLTGTASIDLLVNPNNSGWVNAVTLEIDVTVTGTADLSGSIVSANLASASVNSVDGLNSNIGPIDGAALAVAIEQYIGTVIPSANGIVESIPIVFPILPFNITIAADDADVQTGYVAAGLSIA